MPLVQIVIWLFVEFFADIPHVVAHESVENHASASRSTAVANNVACGLDTGRVTRACPVLSVFPSPH